MFVLVSDGQVSNEEEREVVDVPLLQWDVLRLLVGRTERVVLWYYAWDFNCGFAVGRMYYLLQEETTESVCCA